jgi:hypothetical protein
VVQFGSRTQNSSPPTRKITSMPRSPQDVGDALQRPVHPVGPLALAEEDLVESTAVQQPGQ